MVRAGAGLFYDAFSQDMFLGHLPYPAFYAPGPAYANFGPSPITGTGLNVGTITTGTPLYGPSNCQSTDFSFVECDSFGMHTGTSRRRTWRTTT